MARLGGMGSDSMSTPSAGLASILIDHKLTSNGRANVLLGLVEAVAPQSAFIASSPESSLSEADIGADDPDELKEEDVWAAETGSWQPDLSNPLKTKENSNDGSGASVSTAKRLGVGLGFGMEEDVGTVDILGLGLKGKRRENGSLGEAMLGHGKQRVNGGEVVRSSSRRRERGSGVADAFVNGGFCRHARPLESSTSSHCKMPSCRSSASWMIPQLGGVGKHSSRRHAERQSAPVEVPDWSKIMAKQHKGQTMAVMDDGEEGDKDDDDDRLPPHELLARESARSQRTTFSVCEGQGRTLKGRDLSRVRDAVWSQMGFAD
eukprot:c20445_g1_i2 orf=505-1464(+)